MPLIIHSFFSITGFEESKKLFFADSTSVSTKSNNMSETSLDQIRVFLLVNSTEDGAFANSVCDILSSKFSIPHASVRSAQVPLDRLASVTIGIATPSSPPSLPKVLWVFLNNCSGTGSGTGTPIGSNIQDLLLDPVLELDFKPTHTKAEEISLTIAKFCSLAAPTNIQYRQQVIGQFMTERRQARLVDDAQLRTQSPTYTKAIAQCYDNNLQISGDGISVLKDKRKVGKVRDRYEGEQTLALVTTDRQSGFDRQLARVPFKGAVLNLTSAYWFEQTKHIIPNHLLAVPHPNVSIVKKCKPFPIEFVVR